MKLVQAVAVLDGLLWRIPVVLPLELLKETCVQPLWLFLTRMHPYWLFLGGFGGNGGLES